VAWSDPNAYLEPLLQTNGEMWPPEGNGGNGASTSEVWPNSEVWPESEVWPDSPVWSPALTEPEQFGPVLTEALASGFRDP